MIGCKELQKLNVSTNEGRKTWERRGGVTE